MRIKNHPIIDFPKGKDITFTYNTTTLEAKDTDTIASALHANRITTLSRSIKNDNPRGFFCGIGKCSSCLMRVNGIPHVRTCISPLRPDINVEMQSHYGDLPTAAFIPKPEHKTTTELLVIGGGPAGLMAALSAADLGAQVTLVDDNPAAGGQLIKQTHKFFGSTHERAGTRGITIAKDLITQILEHKNIDLKCHTSALGYYKSEDPSKHTFALVQRHEDYTQELSSIVTNAAVIATGATENLITFPGNDLPGVYGAGGVQTLMNVYGIKPGTRVVMVGAGNVGLIVSYQLLQAGIAVDSVIEASPFIGGYHVHAAKLRRCGVPIKTRHTIKEVHGDTHVSGCTTVELDDHWQHLPATEEHIDCDTICLAVGLTPSTRLLGQIGVQMEHIPEAGGYVAIHDTTMQTDKAGIYVSGDASGIEEASTAMIEGQIAGLAAAHSQGHDTNYRSRLKEAEDALHRLRAGPFGEKPRRAKEHIATYKKTEGRP